MQACLVYGLVQDIVRAGLFLSSSVHINPTAPRPQLKLLCCGGTEGVASTQQHLQSLWQYRKLDSRDIESNVKHIQHYGVTRQVLKKIAVPHGHKGMRARGLQEREHAPVMHMMYVAETSCVYSARAAQASQTDSCSLQLSHLDAFRVEFMC